MTKILDAWLDCRGSGKYTGLFEQETCKACGGTGTNYYTVALPKAKPPLGNASFDQQVSRNCRLMDLAAVKGRALPIYARFDFLKLSYDFIPHGNAYWVYLSDIGWSDSYGKILLKWDGKNTSRQIAMQYYNSSSAYALYRKIQEGTYEKDYTDGVYELIKADP